jgi:hypothetical protein
MSGWSLEKLLAGLHGEIEMRLQRSRAAIGHAVAKGDATEGIWIELLTNYLPRRYRVAKAFVIDSAGTCSFPAFRFHEWLCEVRREGISETRLTYRVHQRVDLLLLTFERQMIG